MKITRVSKTGSAPDLVSEEDTRGTAPVPASPDAGSSSGGERCPWHAGFPSETPKSDELDTYHCNQLLSSASAPASPQADCLKFAAPMASRGRLFANHNRLAKRRLVQKNGECNVKSRNVTKRKRKYIVDIFTTLVDMKWRYHLLLFALFFIVTWCAFGGIWYAIAVYHLDDIHSDNDNWTKCVENVFDYNSALLFSIETQTTIGYGSRVIQPECGFGIFVMMVQSCVGLFVQSLITGVIFSKISRPKGRAQTIMFSERAAVCKRDGEFCLTFRVGDMRKSHIIGTSIRALLVKNRLTAEGESMPLCQYPVDLETETSRSDSFVFLVWPVTVVHRIGSASPLWDLSPEKLLTEHFELIVILEGTVESTGMTTQVRTSYIPSEIMWGQRLVPLLTFQLKNGHYEIDHKQFHNTTPTAMPDCSAKEYADRTAGLTPDELQRESDYPVSFTAPAIRAKGGTTPDRQLYAIFQRNIEGIMRKRGHHHGKEHAKFKVTDGGGGHANRAYTPRSRPRVDQLVQELHHAGQGRIQDGAIALTDDRLRLQKVRRMHSADGEVEISETDSRTSLEVQQDGNHEVTSI